VRKTSTAIGINKIIKIYGLIFCAWLLYRALFHASIWLEEIVIKGIVFSLPFWLLPITGKDAIKTIGISLNNFFQSVYFGITIGMILGLAGQVGNFVRYNAIKLSTYGLESGKIGAFLILSLITAWWEQLLFSGYFLEQFIKITKNETQSIIITSALFTIIHIPAYIFVQHFAMNELIVALLLLFTLGMGCSIIKLRQRNLIAPIMVHAIWGITIYLFR
jgi:membrane protease YdiL (CAAX protease family)